MNGKIKKFINESKRIRLTKDERTSIRSSLLLHMDAHPAGKAVSTFPFALWFTRNLLLRRRIAIILVFFFIATTFLGGVAYASEQALPGDALYPVKLYNESVVGTLAPTPFLKAKWEAKRIERRLKEADKLILAERLHDAALTTIEKNLAEHIENMDAFITSLETIGEQADAAYITSSLEAELAVYEQSFKRAVDQEEMSPRIESLVRHVRNVKIDVKERRAQEETAFIHKARIKNTLSLERDKKRAAIVQHIGTARQRLEKAVSQTPLNPFLHEAVNKISAIQQMVKRSDTLASNQNFEESLKLLQQADHALKEIFLLLEKIKVNKDEASEVKQIELDQESPLRKVPTLEKNTTKESPPRLQNTLPRNERKEQEDIRLDKREERVPPEIRSRKIPENAKDVIPPEKQETAPKQEETIHRPEERQKKERPKGTDRIDQFIPPNESDSSKRDRILHLDLPETRISDQELRDTGVSIREEIP